MQINTSKTNWDLSLIDRQLHTSGVCNDMVAWFEEEKQKVIEANYKFINKWKETNDYQTEVSVLKQALDELQALEAEVGGTGALGYYYGLKSSLDQTNPQVLATLNKIEEFAVKIANDFEFFHQNLSKITPENQQIFLNAPELASYKHFLKGIFENAKYLLTEPEEKILNLKGSVSHGNWVHMTSSLMSKESRTILNEDGKEQDKSFSEIASLMNSTNKKVRDTAAIAFDEIQEKYKGVAENELNSILQNKKINDELRGLKRPDESRHISDDIATEVVDTMLEVVTENFDIAHDFYKLKAKVMGVEKLEYHERNVEVTIDGVEDKNYPWQETVDLTYKVFDNLDPEFGQILKMFVEKGQIDVFPKNGKRGGAFCAHELKAFPTFIMLNHTNKLRDVLTLAHEAGHGINNELMRVQNSINFSTPLSTAEVASTFFEDFVLEELLRGVDKETAFAIKMQKLNDEVSTIIRQVACYNFEKELHKQFNEIGYLSSDQIGEIFSKHMYAYMGDGVLASTGSKNWWVYWGHIRSFFYVYSYASGLLISKAMQKMVREARLSNGQDLSKVALVKTFLSAGSSKAPSEIFLDLGIDITKKEFWENGVGEVRGLLESLKSV